MAAICRQHFQIHFVNQNQHILIKSLLEFVCKGPNDNDPALVQIMAWHGTGDLQLSEAMIAQCTDAFMCHSADKFMVTLVAWGNCSVPSGLPYCIGAIVVFLQDYLIALGQL